MDCEERLLGDRRRSVGAGGSGGVAQTASSSMLSEVQEEVTERRSAEGSGKKPQQALPRAASGRGAKKSGPGGQESPRSSARSGSPVSRSVTAEGSSCQEADVTSRGPPRLRVRALSCTEGPQEEIEKAAALESLERSARSRLGTDDGERKAAVWPKSSDS